MVICLYYHYNIIDKSMMEYYLNQIILILSHGWTYNLWCLPPDDDDNDNNDGIQALVINNELLNNGNPYSYLSCLVGVGRISDRVKNRLFVNTVDGNDNNVVNNFLTNYNRIIIPQIQYETCRRNENTKSVIIDSFRDIAQGQTTTDVTICAGDTWGCCITRRGFLDWTFICSVVDDTEGPDTVPAPPPGR